MFEHNLIRLANCHICNHELIKHPLYEKSGSKYCPHHGDFFVQCLRGEMPTVIFKPFQEEKTRPKHWSPRYGGKPRIAIVCNETGVIYGMIKDAAKALGLDRSSISKHLSKHPYYSHVGGYTFKHI